METLSTLLAICARKSPVTGEFPAQRPVTRSFDVFFDMRLNKQTVNNGEAGDLRRHRTHYKVIVMTHPAITTVCMISEHLFFTCQNRSGNRAQLIRMIGMCSAVVTPGQRCLHLESVERLIVGYQGPLLLTWFNFDPSMDE